ncbi:MAG: hypothetical protein QNJ41_27255 [Xenococcaceae cyanobacterium MO_188.B32]|nr:hypothetical protein [Xenococcaceae cyanobacterium MO_188.B32]
MNTTEPPNTNSPTPKVKADLLLSDRDARFILPRSGWQDKTAWLKAIIKAKRALDIAEIEFLLKQKY